MPMTTPIKSAKNVTVSVTPRPSTRSFQRSSLIKFRIKSAFSFANHSAKTGDLLVNDFWGNIQKRRGGQSVSDRPRVFISFELPPFRFGSQVRAAECGKLPQVLLFFQSASVGVPPADAGSARADVSVKLADTGSTRADAEAFFVGSRRVAAGVAALRQGRATTSPANKRPADAAGASCGCQR